MSNISTRPNGETVTVLDFPNQSQTDGTAVNDHLKAKIRQLLDECAPPKTRYNLIKAMDKLNDTKELITFLIVSLTSMDEAKEVDIPAGTIAMLYIVGERMEELSEELKSVHSGGVSCL